MIFRQAKSQDVESIMQLVQQRIDWMNTQGIHQWNDTDYFGRYPRQYWEEQIVHFLVGEAEGRVAVAIALYDEDIRWTRDATYAPTYTPPQAPKAYYLHHLVAATDARGAGKAMMQHVEQYARQRGVQRLRLDSAVGNEALEAFYTALGYTACGHCHDRLYRGVLREKIL